MVSLIRPPCKLLLKAPNLPASAVIYKSAELSTPSSAILFSNEPDFETLINKIKSPGGTTQAGLESLEKNDLESVFKEAFRAAKNRSIEISNEQ